MANLNENSTDPFTTTEGRQTGYTRSNANQSQANKSSTTYIALIIAALVVLVTVFYLATGSDTTAPVGADSTQTNAPAVTVQPTDQSGAAPSATAPAAESTTPVTPVTPTTPPATTTTTP